MREIRFKPSFTILFLYQWIKIRNVLQSPVNNINFFFKSSVKFQLFRKKTFQILSVYINKYNKVIFKLTVKLNETNLYWFFPKIVLRKFHNLFSGNFISCFNTQFWTSYSNQNCWRFKLSSLKSHSGLKTLSF